MTIQEAVEAHTHAELAPSKAHIWVNCPGAVFHWRNLPPQTAGEHAIRGTHVHKLCEVSVADFLQHKLTGADPDVRFHLMGTEYTAEEIANAIEYRRVIWEKILNQSVTGKAWGTEERFTFDEQLGMFGTTDFWAVYLDDRAKRAADIVDYKNGFGYVEVKGNLQLLMYACSIRKEIRAAGKDLDYVRASIFQPNAGGEPFRSVVFTAKNLDTWEKKFYKAAHQIYVKQKPTFKTGAWCKYCPAQGVCTKYTQEIEKKTALRIVEPDKVVLPGVETLTDEQLSAICLHSDRIVEFIDAAKKHAFNRFLSGVPVPGTKVVQPEGRRGWVKDSVKVRDALVAAGIDQWHQEPKPITITEAEKLLKAKKLPLNGLSAVIEKGEGKPILVPATDPRPAVANRLDLLACAPEED